MQARYRAALRPVFTGIVLIDGDAKVANYFIFQNIKYLFLKNISADNDMICGPPNLPQRPDFPSAVFH